MNAANDTARTAVANTTPVAIELGRTVEIGTLRIHHYADHFRVWDLTNAGKRGKRVATAVVEATYHFRGDRAAWLVSMGKALSCCDSFAAVRRLVADLLVDFPLELRMAESEERGVDVVPAGSQTLEIKTAGGLEITASARDFMVKSSFALRTSTGQTFGRQDTLYTPSGTKTVCRESSAKFFAWLQGNLSAVETMTINELRSQWSTLGVSYDYH